MKAGLPEREALAQVTSRGEGHEHPLSGDLIAPFPQHAHNHLGIEFRIFDDQHAKGRFHRRPSEFGSRQNAAASNFTSLD